MIQKIVRREFLTCRVSKDEKKIIEGKAESSGKDVSTFVRETLLATDAAEVALT